MDAVNAFQVFDDLWTSGQISAKDVAQLPGLGMEVVINLALPSSPNALPGEAELVTGLGLVYIQIPVEWEHPRVEQFHHFAGLLKTFAGRRVWVHCAMNMRVSAFVYLYRKLVLGDGAEDAAYPLREIWEPNETWRDFIRQVESSYQEPED